MDSNTQPKNETTPLVFAFPACNDIDDGDDNKDNDKNNDDNVTLGVEENPISDRS